MNPVVRPYTNDDLALVLRFLSECTSGSPPQSYWHPGDFLWTLYQNTIFDATQSVRLWEDAGRLIGVAILEEPDGVIMQIHPGARISCGVEREMLSWAVESLAQDELWTTYAEAVGAVENPVRSYFESIGLVRGEDHYLNMHRYLDAGGASSARVPEGWTVRPVGPEEEWSRRVDLHREVWSPSRVTLEAYLRMRTVPGYDPSLDLVAVDERGEFGAYCICWYDPISRVGIFEPVGTLESHRRRGLGAESAFVTSEGKNNASRLLYESVGFRTARVEYLYGAKTSDLLLNFS